MKLDKYGLDFIQKEEGLRLKAYKCPAGIWTIGYGNTYNFDNSPVKEGDIITLEQANLLFLNKVHYYENAVNTNVLVPLSQNEFNALVSFTYNVGITAFKNSTLLKKVNSKASADEIKAQFNLWRKGGGVVLSVLIARRKREFNLFKS